MAGTTLKPRCLLVCFNRLMPANQGNARRILQLVRFYKAQGFELDLLYHNEEGFDVGLSDALAREFTRVTVLRSGSRKLISPGHVCRIADWYDPQIDAACADLQRLRGYTLVHANYIWYSPLFHQFGNDVLKVLDTHDMFGERRAKYLAVGMQPQWFSTSYAEEDEALRRVDVAGKEVQLSGREYSILECLLRRPGQVLSRDQLLDYAWPYGAALTPNTVEAYIHLLRDKLGPDAAACIETVRGMGYRLRGD